MSNNEIPDFVLSHVVDGTSTVAEIVKSGKYMCEKMSSEQINAFMKGWEQRLGLAKATNNKALELKSNGIVKYIKESSSDLIYLNMHEKKISVIADLKNKNILSI